MQSIVFLISSALFACMGLAHAEIHADFTVSHGGTPLGTFRARLDHDKAPRTCANFIGLATGNRPWIDGTTGAFKANHPYYDGLTFHRLIHNFMIQGGSPNGQGTDGPGFVIQDEFHTNLRHSGRYKLSMAKSSLPNTGGSQFFITLASTPNLDDKHSVFGEVISGREIIDGFTNSANFPTNGSDLPLTPIVIESVIISGSSLSGFNLNDPALMLPQVRGTRITPSRNQAEGSFTMTFDREAQHNYITSYSFNLTEWTPFRHILSLDDQNQWPLILSVNSNRFFSRMIDVDYSLLPNPPSPLMPNGARLAIADRSGNTLTLVSNGTGGGTWSDTSGANGTITSLVTYDGIGTSAFKVYQPPTNDGPHLIPLAQVMATLNAPTGIHNRNFFNLILSFHSATDGWTDGIASGGSNPISSTILHQFSYTP